MGVLNDSFDFGMISNKNTDKVPINADKVPINTDNLSEQHKRVLTKRQCML